VKYQAGNPVLRLNSQEEGEVVPGVEIKYNYDNINLLAPVLL